MCAKANFRLPWRTRACWLCYNGMIPYLCPELPDKQEKAPHHGVKEPLILHSLVAIQNGTAFQKLGIRQIITPGSYHVFTMLGLSGQPGRIQVSFHVQECYGAVHAAGTFRASSGLTLRDQYRRGRFELIGTPFSSATSAIS